MFHLAIGTPMYGGQCTSEYTQSVLNLTEAITTSGNRVTSIFLGNESLIQRGRNTIAHHFLDTDATHLIFIDADIKFRPADIAKMIKADKELIVGPVPLKGIDWENVRMCALEGRENLWKQGGVFNINHLDGHFMQDEEEPFEIKHGGGAMMLIKREVFESLIPHTDTYINGGVTIPQGKEIYNFFRVEINEEKQLLSEDYFFCESYRKIGGKVWCAPWFDVGHFGSYLFSGKYSETFKPEVTKPKSPQNIFSQL
jgi:hypothetical protein